MNYCILNGKKSTLIKGLLIQSLPPISKPLMRTTKETIDGRDGDIMRNVGYSAYDKTMSIGLFGDFDIDEVIKFFDSEGKVVFSNEPDKFYYYKIVNQIDFEKLIRFRTATVTFHCQPFKYSAIEDDFSIYRNQLSFKKSSSTFNGITVNCQNGVISVKGTPTDITGFYIPITPMTLIGENTLSITTQGTGANLSQLRVIGDTPSDEDSFGGTYVQLDSSVTLTDTLSESKTFRYIYLFIGRGSVDFTISAQMNNEDLTSFDVFNRGNIQSRPRITLYGSGTVNLSINNVELFTITLNEYITIDGAEMNAYKGDTLSNRSVSGDYKNLLLNVGNNTISWVGNVSQIEIENVSRWI